MKTEVYSWRLSADLKADLENEARRRKTSVGAVLDEAARTLLEKNASGEEEERRVRARVMACVGTVSGGSPSDSRNVGKFIKEDLRRKYEQRQRSH